MKTFADRTIFVPIPAMAAFLIFLAMATADAKTAGPDGEMKLSNEITMLNNDAKIPDGGRIAAEHLMQSFKVSGGEIATLRGKNLEYGEIAAVLGTADKMSGGVNGANINKVLNMRERSAGWPQVATNLGIDPGDVAEKVGKIEDDVHKEIKSAAGGGYTGRGAGGTEGTSGTPTTSSERDVGTAGSDY